MLQVATETQNAYDKGFSRIFNVIQNFIFVTIFLL